MPDAANNREGPQAREPSKCLKSGAMEEDWPKRPSDHPQEVSYKRLKKRLFRAVTPGTEAVCDPALFALRRLHAQLSRRQSCHRKKKSCVYACRATSVVSNSLRPCKLWPARLLCQGFLQARIQEGIGQYWLPYPSRALYILPPSPPTPLSVWCCQNPCDTSSYTTSTAGPHRGKPKSSRAASGAIPSG